MVFIGGGGDKTSQGRSFEDVIYESNDLEGKLELYRKEINDEKEEWEKRNNQNKLEI
jgi:hypothetical protein